MHSNKTVVEPFKFCPVKKSDKYYALTLLVALASKLPNLESESSGGYFCEVETNEAGNMITDPKILEVGTMPIKKKFGRVKNALEKITRIIENFLKTSFEMRDDTKDYWGGGIRYKFMVCAFSGFPELVDEAISLIFAVYSSYKGNREAFEIALAQELKEHRHYEKNPHIQPLLKAFLEEI